MSGPPKKPTGVTRELDRATEAAWRSFSAHGDRCQVCERRGDYCTLGRVLLRHWCALRDLMEEPSQLAVLHVSRERQSA